LIGGDPVDAGNDARHRSAPVAVQHPHGDQRDALGDSIGRPADRAGDVGAMAVAVVRRAAVDHVVPARHTAGEFAVIQADAGVQDVDAHALPGGGIDERSVQRQGALVDPVQPPGSIVLDGVRADDLILLDVCSWTKTYLASFPVSCRGTV
jgi:hypothetical protein